MTNIHYRPAEGGEKGGGMLEERWMLVWKGVRGVRVNE